MTHLSGFQIGNLIYRGNSTSIYRGLRSHDQQPVVMKLLSKPYPSIEELSCFKREYEIMRRFNTSGIVKAYSLEKSQSAQAIILEDFNGQSIEKLLPGWGFNLTDFLKLSIRITNIIARIHQEKIIHKNINPGNIIWNPENSIVKITDFGAASQILPEAPDSKNKKNVPDQNIIEGELAYISPEQTGRMNRSIDFQTDFYSLGVTLYEIATKQLPFAADNPVKLIHSHIARTPVNPGQLNHQLPDMVSEIILKLMEKAPENRYQGVFGLKSDLLECLHRFNKKEKIQPFKIARKDISGRFQIPQRLYGREHEINILADAFNRVRKGSKETILISGQSGSGKSSLVNEIRKKTSESQEYIIYGKFDQLCQNVPFAALRQAFLELDYQISAGGIDKVSSWKQELIQSVGKNGQVIIDVIPELESLIGKQPEAPLLPPADAQNRFNRTFLNLIRTFSSKQQLIIIIDDLQWSDEASLKLIELIINDANIKNLLFIGTLRDDELSDAHPLTVTIKNLRSANSLFTPLNLHNLTASHIEQLLSATLSCDPEKCDPLVKLCFEKTHGNPFFLKQFLHSLHRDGKIYFGVKSGTWQWDVKDFQLAGITDNVIELMTSKIHNLPETTQSILQAAACIGTQFDLLTTSQVMGTSMKKVASALEYAISESIIFPTNDSNKFITIIDQELDTTHLSEIPKHLIPYYKFAHDRIQQAVYSLISETKAIEIHDKIGRLYLTQTREIEKPEKIFEIVNQLNLGTGRDTRPNEKIELADLNLQAGRKAKKASAFKPSLTYFKTGIVLLPENSWKKEYDLTLALYSEAAESAMLCIDFQSMEQLADIVLSHARSSEDKIKIHDLMIQSYYARNDLIKVLDTGLDVLKSLGSRFPKNPTTAHILLKLARAKLVLAGKPIRALKNLQDMTNQESLATMRIGFNLAHAAYGARPKLNSLLGLHGVIQSVKHGIAPESPAGFAGYGMALCGMLNDINSGLEFGKLALSLNDRECAKNYRARTILIVSAFIEHWEKHLSKTLSQLKEAHSLGLEIGDFEFGTLSAYFYCAHSFFTGTPLDTLSRELADYSIVISEFKQETHFYFNEMIRQTVLNFRGETDDPSRLTGEAYDEKKMLLIHRKNNDTSAIHMLFSYKLMLGYHFEKYPEAYESSETLKPHLEGMTSSAYIPLFHFYDALLRLATFTDMNPREQKQNLKTIARHQKKLKKWAARAPMNFLHKWTLVEAERLRILGEDIKAARHYDNAVSLAAQQEYLQEEALANELGAKFWLTRNNQQFAELYMTKAVHCYKLWNAQAKVDFLHEHYPQLIIQASLATAPTPGAIKPSLTSHSTEALDLSSVIKASQAISGEIVLDQLLKKLITVLIESAGAQKALLLSEYNNQWVIEAEGTVAQDDITALTEFKKADPTNTPLSILGYVAQTKKNIVLNNVAQDAAFKQDPYISDHQPLSVLCSPIFHQGQLANILYLENNLISGAFTPDRIELIQFLSSQAAISLQNASLYFRLQASEKKYRSIFENAIEGIFQLSTDGRFISVNQSLAKMLGYDSPKALMASDENMKYHFFSDLEAREQFAEEFREKGQITGYEIPGTRKDNSIIWGSISIRTVHDSTGQISHYEGSVMDITHKKNNEKAEREAEAAKAAAKAKGEFLTNISHEIRTPINAIVGMTELALETELNEKQHEYLRNIKIASDALIHLINDILHFSKIEAGKIEIEHIEFKISDITEKIFKMFAGELSKNKTEFICSPSKDIPETLIGDPLKISQILINLVSNAIKFTDTGKIELHIEPVSRTNESVQLQFFVRDTGIGIAKKHINKLFDSFTQADGSITRKYGGTGLGLSISKNLVEMMGGRIWAESIEGRGSTFYFEISCKHKTFSPETKIHVAADISGRKVLLVEDNPINRQIVIEILESRALTVDVVENGQQAVESVRKNTYDAVLMDIHMPVMDGFTATRIIREDMRNTDIPIIAMTAHAIDHNKEKCLQAGMDEFISKPFEPAQLMAKLAKCIAHDIKVGPHSEKEKNNLTQARVYSAFPERLPGININAAILRMEGKRDLYIRILSEFFNNYQDIGEKIQDGVKNHNTEFVKRTAHTLKSIAGNIGAEQLQQTARIIETKASDNFESIDEQIFENLKNNLNQVFLSIQKILDEHS